VRREGLARQVPTAVLLLVAVGLSVIAYRVLPSGTSASAPGEFALVDTSPMPVTSLNVTESRDSAGESVFNIVAVVPSSEGLLPDVWVDLGYPSGRSGDRPTCDPPSPCYDNNGYLPFTVGLVNDNKGTSTEVDYAARVRFRGPALGFSSDETDATSQLPSVQVPLTVAAQQFLIGAVEVHATLTNASTYDWTTGQSPITAKGNVLTWYLNLQPQGSATGSMFDAVSSSAGAVNQAAQQHALHLTFLSGALIGVAGGALVGAIQLMLTRREVDRDVGDELTSDVGDERTSPVHV
jgi:hypothetical protein